MGKGHFLLLNTDRGEPSLFRKRFTGGQQPLFFLHILSATLAKFRRMEHSLILGIYSRISQALLCLTFLPRIFTLSQPHSPFLLSCRRIIQFIGFLLCQQYLAWGCLLPEMPARPTHTQGGATSHPPFTWYQMSRALLAWSCKIKYDSGLHLPGLSPDRCIYLSYLNTQA